MRLPFDINISGKDLFVFIVGLTSMIKLRLLGTFGIGELIVFASYIYINPLFVMRDKQIRRLMAFACLWLAGAIFSDLVNQANLIDSLKGAFNVIFLIMLIPFGYWALYDKPTRMLWFWAGIAISAILGFKYQQVNSLDKVATEIWQVYAIKWLFLFLGGWLYYKGRTKLAYIIIMGFAVWTLYNMSRNIFLTFTLATVLTIFIGKVDENNKSYKYWRYRNSLVKIAIIILVAFIGIKYTYETLAANGTLGERAKIKYEMQSNSEIGLASGRIDFLASLYAISKRPIIGYGSYAKDDGVTESFYKMIGNQSITKLNYIPGHSYILGGWVYAGILGLFFWIFVLKEIFTFMLNHIFNEPRLLYINMLLTATYIWSILFSPFSNRMNFVIFIITIIILSERRLTWQQIAKA